MITCFVTIQVEIIIPILNHLVVNQYTIYAKSTKVCYIDFMDVAILVLWQLTSLL